MPVPFQEAFLLPRSRLHQREPLSPPWNRDIVPDVPFGLVGLPEDGR
ncbi:hypothetical protein PC116_g24794 [Phytophthora cactorum]|nr:hypothetical protein PC119_g23523 [Phytophthora cactorum]KAG2999132.1 hypothetical protein PC120_g20976 [Phytophthora cactorum]KAG3133376.1 hypothetical protein PC128_g26342 [Phytophthora cactorum]KAG4042131.1 hypothetical protein PC123_g22370 [Phytophthora cactorum]KAG4226799.1 hypothetical protein PC116_g24794 [Phytophthora cactorum]